MKLEDIQKEAGTGDLKVSRVNFGVLFCHVKIKRKGVIYGRCNL